MLRIRFMQMALVLILLISVESCKDKAELSKQDANVFCSGTVVETMNSNGYTYTLVKTEFEKYIWTAAPETRVTVGDKVSVPHGSIMENFTSKTLGKTFPHILFVSQISVNGEKNQNGAMSDGQKEKAYCPPAPHGLSPESDKSAHKNAASSTKNIVIGNIEKAKGGYTVSECYSKSVTLEGKTVVLRGKVVKFSENIMGKNWIHLRDGSGQGDTSDITITTSDRVAVGKTVLVSGKLARNRDPGAGYHYPVLIEEARVKAE